MTLPQRTPERKETTCDKFSYFGTRAGDKSEHMDGRSRTLVLESPEQEIKTLF